MIVIATLVKLELKEKNKIINFTRIIIGCFCQMEFQFWYIIEFLFKLIPFKKRLKILIEKIILLLILQTFFIFIL